jgi:hypothetical protein
MFADACCSPIGNCGAGATTCVRPMLMSVNLLEALFSICGGGSTIAACGAWTARRESAASTSGAGATTDADKAGVCFNSLLTSGGGATTVAGSAGNFKSDGALAIDAAGILGVELPHATTFGKGTSCSNFSFGGETIVWVRLSASGGTEMIGCGAYAGSPLFATSTWVPPVSSGATYSEAS